MALILLAFVGTLTIFFRIWRELDAVRRALGDIRESLQYNAMDIAQQNRELMHLSAELRRLAATDGGVGSAPASDNLGTLLERGLPNLMDNRVSGGEGASTSHTTLPFGRVDEDDDFLRRLEAGPEKKLP
jgi:hypothetical protein